MRSAAQIGANSAAGTTTNAHGELSLQIVLIAANKRVTKIQIAAMSNIVTNQPYQLLQP